MITFFLIVSEELREIMASLGFRTMDEMIGHSERLKMGKAIDHYKARSMDFSKILYKPGFPRTPRCVRPSFRITIWTSRWIMN